MPLCPHSTAHLKTVTFTVRASAEQARRWALAARYLRCKSVPAWLQGLADRAVLQLEAEIGLLPRILLGGPKRRAKRGPYRRKRGGSL